MADKPRIAVLVPAPEYPEDWHWTYDVEAAALAASGAQVDPVPWTGAENFGSYDLILPLVAWGYQSDPARWFELLDRLEAAAAPVANAIPILRWNTNKAYLEELARKGVPTVPTRTVESLDRNELESIRQEFGPDLVIKPPVSASAYGTFRLGVADELPKEAAGREMMVQPFLRSIVAEGEYSLIYFDGRFSHAIVKRARDGDYRVQPHLGGTELPCDPPEGSQTVAERALAAAPAKPAYARIDLIRLDDGQLAVIELELIEPSLWLQHAPDKGSGFVESVYGAIKQTPKQPLP